MSIKSTHRSFFLFLTECFSVNHFSFVKDPLLVVVRVCIISAISLNQLYWEMSKILATLYIIFTFSVFGTSVSTYAFCSALKNVHTQWNKKCP